jgi:hypothetical protein
VGGFSNVILSLAESTEKEKNNRIGSSERIGVDSCQRDKLLAYVSIVL